MSTTTTRYQPYSVNPRVKIAGLWASTMFVFGYVDLFSLYRADIRADLDAGKVFGLTIGQGVLLATTVYILVPSVLLSLSLVLSPPAARVASLVVAAILAITVAGSALGEWS